MTEQTKDHDIWCWKSSLWFETCTKMCIYLLVSHGDLIIKIRY